MYGGGIDQLANQAALINNPKILQVGFKDILYFKPSTPAADIYDFQVWMSQKVPGAGLREMPPPAPAPSPAPSPGPESKAKLGQTSGKGR